ncbi:MAG: SCO7613 C-terminal domain-containing membrane protein [Acidimicrobiales bacterium]
MSPAAWAVHARLMAESLRQGIPPFPPPAPVEPSSAAPVGARWVAALGAFLLVAAAATFVAVRWDDIPQAAKLGALIAVTCACIAAHRRLRSSLPVTAGALFHLGVLLVPIDMTAVGIQAGWTWDEMLLAQGLAATAVFGIAAQVERSVVLRCAAWLGVVLLAAGIGGTTVLPAGPVLAGVALLTVASHRAWTGRAHDLDLDRAAAGWATLAGLAVPLAGADQLGWPAAGVLVDLGLAGDPAVPLTAVTGLVAGVALGIVGQRWRSVPVALLGIAVSLVGATTSWVGFEPSGSEPPGTESLVAAATLFLLAEVAAWSRRSDPFWAKPTEIVANVAEGLAGVFTLVLGGIVLLAPLGLAGDPAAGLAAGLTALGWATTVVRHPAARQNPLTPCAAAAAAAAAVAAVGAVTLTTESALATAIALTMLGTAVLFGPAAGTSTGPPTGQVLVVGLLGWAPIVAYEDPVAAAVLGLIGALVVAEAAVRAAVRSADRHRAEPPGGMAAPLSGRASTGWAPIGAEAGPAAPVEVPAFTMPTTLLTATLLTVGTLVPLASGAAVLAADGWVAAAAIGATCAAWVVALLLDRAAPHDSGVTREVGWSVYRWFAWLAGSAVRRSGRGARRSPTPWDSLAFIPRVAAVVPLAAAPAMEPKHVAVLGALVAAFALADATRLDQPPLVVGAGIGGPVAVVGMALASDSTVAEAGLGVMLIGVAWLGIGGSLPRRWVTPTMICAGIAAVTGLLLSVADAAYLSTNLLVLGVGLAGLGAVISRPDLTVCGIGVATVGLWGHLALAEVQVSEPYIAPVALLILAAGISGHHAGRTSSWVAFAPSVGLLGGSGLLERLGGGPAWHALVAGAVGVVAVVAGATWRLAGPLLIGTALVVAVTIHETLDTTANLHAGVWLASGGAVLLVAGVAMERRGTGPYETGRRLVDLIRERFV